MSLTNGHTEAWPNPPAGNYAARVEFIDNAAPGRARATSPTVNLRVER